VLGQTWLRRLKVRPASAGEQRNHDLDDIKIVIDQQRRERTHDEQKGHQRAIKRN
jgi:hypothetical protein